MAFPTPLLTPLSTRLSAPLPTTLPTPFPAPFSTPLPTPFPTPLPTPFPAPLPTPLPTPDHIRECCSKGESGSLSHSLFLALFQSSRNVMCVYIYIHFTIASTPLTRL